MARKLIFLLAISLIAGLVFTVTSPAAANPEPNELGQVYYQTATPDADGRILYIVQADDTCLRVSLLTGVDLNTLQQLNNLDEACTLVVGQQLLLAISETPVVPTGPAVTDTPSAPTTTPFPGNGQVCIYLFEDINGNSLPETGESQVAGGAVSVTDRRGSISLTGNTTQGADPLCFQDLPEGDYNISVAPPEGYNPTTSMNYPLRVQAGDSSVLDFGAQVSSAGPTGGDPETGGAGATSPLLAILGGVLIVGGLGLGFYVYWLRKSSI